MLQKLVWGSALMAATFAMAQENYATWPKYRTLTVNTTSSGANVTANVNNFPLLVRLDSTHADIFATAGARAGLRFTNPAGNTRYPHSVDMWDSAGKKAAIWVRMDVPGNATTSLRLYFGKTGVADSANASAVFDTATGFKAVWGLGESAGPSADATVLASPMTWFNGITSVPGVVGNAVQLANNPFSTTQGQYLTSPYNPATQNFKANKISGITLSVWARRTATNGAAEQSVFGQYDWTNAHRQAMLSARSSGNWRLFRSTNGSAETDYGNVAVVDGQWVHLTATLKNGEQKLYVNGVVDVTQTTADLQVLDSAWTNSPFSIGRMNPNRLDINQNFHGAIDEARFAATVRSAEWVKLDYETQKPGATALTIGATITPGAGLTNLHFGNDTIVSVINNAFTRTATFTGGPVDSFKVVSGSLPTGLALGKTSGTISGTPTAAMTAANVVVRAWAGLDSASVTLRVSAVQGLENLKYIASNTASRDTLRFEVSVAKSVTPTITGTPTKYSISGGALPAGLSFDTLTGAISGTATATANSNRTVTATGPYNTVTRDINLDVIVGPPSASYYPSDTLSATVGASISAAPILGGRALTKWTAVTALPAGLRLDTLNGTISGTPTTAAAAASYTIRGTSASDTLTKTLRITVSAAAADGDYKTAWSGHRRIKLNTAASGANVTGTLTNVPVLVRFDSTQAAVFTNGGTNGASLRFTKTNATTRLPHEIDHWDAAARKGAVWVLLDTVRGNNATQEIQLHYGNANASPVSNANAVFSETNGFVSVFHLGGGTRVSPRLNAVVGRNPAVPVNLPNAYASRAGIIGQADSLGNGGTAANSQHLSFGPMPVGTFPSGNLTYSLWVKQNAAITDWRHMVSLGSGSPSNNIWIGHPGDAAGGIRVRTAEGNQERTAINAAGAASPGNWLKVHLTLSGSEGTIYTNGASVASGNIGHTIADVARASAFIGRSLWPDSGFAGLFDEVRIANVARSGDWVKFEYENQKPDQKVVTIDTLSFTSSVAGLLRQGPGLSFQSLGQGVLFQARSAEAAQFRIAVLDIHGRTLWNHTARTEAGVSRVSWNGLTHSGRPLSSGIYSVRMALVDAQGKVVSELNRSLPLMR